MDFKKFGSVMVILRKFTNVEMVRNMDFTRNFIRMETLKIKLIIKAEKYMDHKKSSAKMEY